MTGSNQPEMHKSTEDFSYLNAQSSDMLSSLPLPLALKETTPHTQNKTTKIPTALPQAKEKKTTVNKNKQT